jgi:hypothetical protein
VRSNCGLTVSTLAATVIDGSESAVAIASCCLLLGLCEPRGTDNGRAGVAPIDQDAAADSPLAARVGLIRRSLAGLGGQKLEAIPNELARQTA